MEEPTRKRIHQIEIIAALVLLLVAIVSFFPNPGITGYVSIETKKQEIDLSIANSQSYVLTTNSPEPFFLTSLKISGNVIGEGIAKAYITNKDQKILIYSNVVKKEKGIGAITGMERVTGRAVEADAEEGSDLVIQYLENIEGEAKEIKEDEELVSGNFKDECSETCFIEMLLDKDTAYQLLFYIEEGTILNINEIVYTIKKD